MGGKKAHALFWLCYYYCCSFVCDPLGRWLVGRPVRWPGRGNSTRLEFAKRILSELEHLFGENRSQQRRVRRPKFFRSTRQTSASHCHRRPRLTEGEETPQVGLMLGGNARAEKNTPTINGSSGLRPKSCTTQWNSNISAARIVPRRSARMPADSGAADISCNAPSEFV